MNRKFLLGVLFLLWFFPLLGQEKQKQKEDITAQTDAEKASANNVSYMKYLSLLSESMAYISERYFQDVVAAYKKPDVASIAGKWVQSVDPVSIINNNQKVIQSLYEQEQIMQFGEYYNTRVKLRNTRIILLSKTRKEIYEEIFRIEFDKVMTVYKELDLLTAKFYLEDLFEAYQEIIPDKISEVLYWSAECSFGMRFFVEARKKYEALLLNYKSSPRTQAVMYRMMLMDYIEDNSKDLLDRYENYKGQVIVNKVWKEINKKTTKYDKMLTQLHKNIADKKIDITRISTTIRNSRTRAKMVERLEKEYSEATASLNDSTAKSTSIEEAKTKLVSDGLDSMKMNVPYKYVSQDSKIILMYSIVLYQLGRIDAAFDELNKIPYFVQESDMARYVQVLCYAKKGQYIQANDVLSTILDLGKKSQPSVIDKDLIERARFIMAKLYYEQANNLLAKADEVNYYDVTRQAIADSIEDSGWRERKAVEQIRQAEKQVVSDYVKTQKMRGEQDSLAEQVSKEGMYLTDLDEVIQKYAYRSVVSNDTTLKATGSMIDDLLDHTNTLKKDIKTLSDDLDRLVENSKGTQVDIQNARKELREKLARIKYSIADNIFSSLDKDHSDKAVAGIGSIWANIKQKNYDKSIDMIKDFLRDERTSDKTYQAILAQAYIVQQQYPSNITELLNTYRFIWDGEATFLYVKKFINYRVQIMERKYYFEQVLQKVSNKEIIEKIQHVIKKIDDIVGIITFDAASVSKLQLGQILSDRQRVILQEISNDLTMIEQEWDAAGGRLKMDKGIVVQINQIVNTMLDMGQTDFKDIKYFEVHAPAFLQAELDDYEKELEIHRKTTAQEIINYQRLLDVVPRDKKNKTKEEIFLDEFYKQSLEDARNKNNAINILLKQRKFYSTDIVSKTAKESRYSFVASIYDYIKKISRLKRNYEGVIKVVKDAIRKKVDALKANMDEISTYINSREMVATTESVVNPDDKTQEFNAIINDFSKAYFIGTQHLLMNNKNKPMRKLLP